MISSRIDRARRSLDKFQFAYTIVKQTLCFLFALIQVSDVHVGGWTASDALSVRP